MTRSPFVVKEPARTWGFFRALPSNIVAMFLHTYRALISPLYGQVCRFFPSCSAYTLEAVYVHGAVKGLAYGCARICRCHPWQRGGLDAVPPGHRIWDEGRQPKIIQLNHPPVPADDGMNTTEDT